MASSNHLTLEQKHSFIQLVGEHASALAEVCRGFRISRQPGYKWRRRYRQAGLAGLVEQSCRPHASPHAPAALWVARLRLARQRRNRWGPKKRCAWLRGQHPRSRMPSVSTLGRLLRRHGWSRAPRGRRRGPDRAWPAFRSARRPNEVWPVDFKGCFHTADGRRCDPLTGRDAYRRYGLWVRVLHGHKLATVPREFVRLFHRFGLPRRLQADQGRPWAGPGPAWRSQWRAWWVSLGSRPPFSRRARPGDNAAQEQWHRELKADDPRPPSATPQAPPRRLQNWRHDDTQARPQEALGLIPPAQVYSRSRRRERGARPPRYPRGWSPRRGRPNGGIQWLGRSRFIGEAFVRQHGGLKPWRQDRWRVYFYDWLSGEIQAHDLGAMRPALYHRRHQPKGSARS